MTLVVSRRSLDWQICDELMDCPAGMTVNVLADELGASPSAIYCALDRLERRGFVERIGRLSREEAQSGREQNLWSMTRTKRVA